jgi:hypothetical protein
MFVRAGFQTAIARICKPAAVTRRQLNDDKYQYASGTLQYLRALALWVLHGASQDRHSTQRPTT